MNKQIIPIGASIPWAHKTIIVGHVHKVEQGTQHWYSSQTFSATIQTEPGINVYREDSLLEIFGCYFVE